MLLPVCVRFALNTGYFQSKILWRTSISRRDYTAGECVQRYENTDDLSLSNKTIRGAHTMLRLGRILAGCLYARNSGHEKRSRIENQRRRNCAAVNKE